LPYYPLDTSINKRHYSGPNIN